MQLIQLVKDYPILYDLANPNHKNSGMKLVVWEQIADILGETGNSLLYYFCIKFVHCLNSNEQATKHNIIQEQFLLQ